ncbi:sialate O-acetylesterase [Luteimonas suaedae]|uniref:sialate O-acetylesterase n=1 Tax=Luteimonas suaedae TaxID=2605430 RepID=UPI0021041219|nr:sialate O-acetylesterase [Luteimonas suaedae]
MALVLLLLAFSLPAHAAVELPLLFSDGAVLQRDRPLPVWGWAAPGIAVQVAFDGRRAEAVADADGRWLAVLPAHAAGGPFEITVTAGDETVTVRDVLVGDVWLASGQSNMEWPLLQTNDAEAEIARADDPQIRHFKVPKSWADTPQVRLAGGAWAAASPLTVGDFSAVGYHFARELRAATGVPIGIIDSSWGGSAIEAWMDADMLGLDTAALSEKMRGKREADTEVEARTRGLIARWPETAAGGAALSVDALDTADWADIEVPALWEAQGYSGMDGEAWYRTTFELSADEAAAGVTLGLGQIDDSDRAWVNGQPVGGMENGWSTPRAYPVPAAALRAGANTLAVRVTDTGGGGGIAGSAEQLYVAPADGARRPLAGEWKFRTTAVTVSLLDDKNQIDTLLYNAMIRPLQPYPLRGAIWYQGETNAWPEGAWRYREQFADMIRGWRGDWNAPELPFLWAQLASFASGGDRTDADGRVLESPWAVLRESQTVTLALPATAQAVTIDVGDAHDIHPRDKRTVGQRLALAARHVAYGEDLVFSGPVYRAIAIEGDRAVLRFDLQGSALAVRGGGEAVHGFEIAGADRVFRPAQARIAGDTVVVRSDAVPAPVAARYAWRDNPEDADLANREGLPASPFRTEEW